MRIGDRIKQVALEVGMSHNRIAAQLGEVLSDRNFRLILAGRTLNPSIKSVSAIASALGVPTDYLTVGVEGIIQPQDADPADAAGVSPPENLQAVLSPKVRKRLERSGVDLGRLVNLLQRALDAGVHLDDVLAAATGKDD